MAAIITSATLVTGTEMTAPAIAGSGKPVAKIVLDVKSQSSIGDASYDIAGVSGELIGLYVNPDGALPPVDGWTLSLVDDAGNELHSEAGLSSTKTTPRKLDHIPVAGTLKVLLTGMGTAAQSRAKITLLLTGGSSESEVSKTKLLGFDIPEPEAGLEVPITTVDFNGLLTEVRHVVKSATNVVFNLEVRSVLTPFTAGTEVWASDKTATVSSVNETAFTAAGIDGRSTQKQLVLVIVSVSGTPERFNGVLKIVEV